jgi:flagella basal body P-ring formation protein FlgA
MGRRRFSSIPRWPATLPAAALVSYLAAAAVAAGAPQARPTGAEAVIEAALRQRLGARIDVVIGRLEPAVAGAFREARPDPSATLGKPMRFTLIPAAGAAIGVVAEVEVVADYAIARREIGRNHVVEAEDLTPRRGVLRDVPLRAPASAAMLAGARALRPIAAGAVVQAAFVRTRRAIEPGDRVTVVAVSGPVEVSAVFVAADGGPIGATIRVLNPETRRLIRGRIVGDALVEVLHGR